MAREQPVKRDEPMARKDEKKPYRAPRLTEYGDLRTITRAKGGNMDDGSGEPPTKK